MSIFQVDSEVDDILSKSPFFSKGESWQKSRSEISKAFEPDCVKNSYSEVLETCRKLVKLLEKKSQYPPINGINVKDIALRFIAEIISHTVYGMEAGDFEKEELPEFLRVASSPFAQSILTSLYFFIPSSLKFKKVAFLPDTTKDYLNDLIQKSINQRKEKKVSKGDFLNFLQKLQEEKGLSPSELSSHAITFMIDGFETTATLITHVLFLVSFQKYNVFIFLIYFNLSLQNIQNVKRNSDQKLKKTFKKMNILHSKVLVN